MGVFATRSPYRPNAIGLSCVKLTGVEKGKDGITLKVAGADLMNGTPIYDIKPYLVNIVADMTGIVINTRFIENRRIKIKSANRIKTDFAAVIGKLVECPEKYGALERLFDCRSKVSEMECAADNCNAVKFFAC